MKQTGGVSEQRLTHKQKEPPNAPLESKDTENSLRRSLGIQNYLNRKTTHMQGKETQLENILHFKTKKSISTWKIVIRNRHFFQSWSCTNYCLWNTNVYMYLLVLKVHRPQWVLSFKPSSHIECKKTPSKLLNSCVCLWTGPASAIHTSSALHTFLLHSLCCHQHCPKPAYAALHSTLLQQTFFWCNCNAAGRKVFRRKMVLRKPNNAETSYSLCRLPNLVTGGNIWFSQRFTNTTTTQHAGKGSSLFGRILEQIKYLFTKQKDYTEKCYWTTCKQFPDTLLSCSDTLT